MNTAQFVRSPRRRRQHRARAAASTQPPVGAYPTESADISGAYVAGLLLTMLTRRTPAGFRPPSPAAFTVRVGESTAVVVEAQRSNANFVQLTLSLPVLAADVVTVQYAAATAGTRMQDPDGTPFADFGPLLAVNQT